MGYWILYESNSLEKNRLDMKRRCNWCGAYYIADNRNLKRGWGLCCSKSCAAKLRENAKTGQDRCTNTNDTGKWNTKTVVYKTVMNVTIL